MNDVFRSLDGRMRLVACALLIIAAMFPMKTCENLSKSRQEDGSLTFTSVQREQRLWQEISRDYTFMDTSIIVLFYSWPLAFVLFRAPFKTWRTRRPLGIAECIVGSLFLLMAVGNAWSPCWSIFGETKPHVEAGSYLAITGNVLYLAAWPLETILRSRRP